MAGSNIELNPYEGTKLKRGGYDIAGDVPSEFGGLPGFYTNADPDEVVAKTGAVGAPYGQANPLSPAQERTSLTQTVPADPTSSPRYGNGGDRIV